MKINSGLRGQLNRLCSEYCGWRYPAELRELWDRLSNEFGINILITGAPNDVAEDGGKSWVINYQIGEEDVDNSRFVYQVYEGTPMDPKNEYNMYFS